MFYLVTGHDGSSDNGYFDVIVQADTRATAKKIVKEHLVTKGRVDLGVGSVRLLKDGLTDGVLYSTVENR